MKSRELESDFELYVTRTPGYLWALLFRALHVHPIAVTLMSICIGAASGYFFYFDDLRMNLIGMLLLVWANWYDCADGQLARMTNQRTLIGRILDGFAGDVWFFCIYLGIVLRLFPTWGISIWLLGAWAGFYCHTHQCALADYYRNIHLWVTQAHQGDELDDGEEQRRRQQSLRWLSRDWFEKLYLFFYVRYTKRQERQTPAFQRLRPLLATLPADSPIREQFRQDSLPLMPLCNILTFDTRVIVLFLSLAAGQPWLYFIFESTVLEVLRLYTRRRHETFCCKYYKALTSQS